MKIKVKKVYYCDFCKKHRLQPNIIIEHEKHCTANPERQCLMCEGVEEYAFTIINLGSEDYERKTIEVNGTECPACTLSFVRLNGITNIKIKGKNNDTWDYKKQVENWWTDRNSGRIENIGFENI